MQPRSYEPLLSRTSIVQNLAHSLDIVNHLTHPSNAVGLENVVVPLVGWRVGGDRMRSENIRSSSVFVKGEASAERADSGEARRDEVRAKIEEVFAHPLICLLALGVEVQGRWCVDLDKEHRMPVELYGEREMNVGCIMGIFVRPPVDVERTIGTKKLVQEFIV